MNAHEMQKRVIEAEGEILRAVGNAVAGRVNALCAETGLEFSDVQIRFVESTRVGSQGREYAANSVDLEMRLPEKIRPY